MGMDWGSSDEDAKQPSQEDYITTEMLRQMNDALGSSIKAYSIPKRRQRISAAMAALTLLTPPTQAGMPGAISKGELRKWFS